MQDSRAGDGCSVSHLVSELASSDVSRKKKYIIVGKLKQLPSDEVQSHCLLLLNSQPGREILMSASEYILQAKFGLPESFCHRLLDHTVTDIYDSPAGSARLLRSCQTALKLLRGLPADSISAEVIDRLRKVLTTRAREMETSNGTDCLCLVYLLLVSVQSINNPGLTSLTPESLSRQSWVSSACPNSRLAIWHALLTQDASLCRRQVSDDSSAGLGAQQLIDSLLYSLQLDSESADKLLLSKTVLLSYEALIARCETNTIASSNPSVTTVVSARERQLTQLTLDYVMAHMESHIFLVKHNCSAIFNCLVQLIDRLAASWESVLRRVHSLSWDSKAKYALLQGLANVQPRLVLTACPNVLRIAVRHSREHVLGYYASDLFLALVPHCHSANHWLDALVKGVDSASDSHLLSVRDHFLQKLVRLREPAFLTTLCRAEYTKHSHRASQLKLLILSAGLKRVRLGSEESNALASLLRPACFWLNSRISFDAFNIWLNLQQQQQQQQRSVLTDLFKFGSEFFMNWLGCARSEERQRLLAVFQSFLKRSHAWVKSTFDAAEEAAAFYLDQMIQLCRGFLCQLHPGCSFPRRSSILELSCALLEHTLHNDVSGAVNFNPRQLLSSFSAAVAAQIADTFDANRANAVHLLSLIMDSGQDSLADALAASAVSMHRSWRPQDASTAHHLFAALTHPSAPAACRLALSNAFGSDSVEGDGRVRLVEWLTDQLESQVLDAETSGLRVAAVRSPMHPTLHCLRRLATSTASVASAERLLSLASRAANAVSPLMSSSAPEGGIVDVEGFPLGPGLSLEAGCFSAGQRSCDDDPVNLPEFLVVCCWRTVKEASLLVAELSERLIVDRHPGEGDSGGEQFRERIVLRIHAFYKELLFDSRHRGAFELAYEGFGRFCASVWRCRPPLGHLPECWLAELLANLSGPPTDDLRLCLTRRSAGLPYYILGIVSSEPAPVKSAAPASLRQAFDALFSLASSRNGVEDEFVVHVYNTLPALFSDSRVGPATSQWVAPALCLALDGFPARNWSIRNSCTRLFSALFVRIFGVTRCREETSKKNVLSTSVFFHRYPGVYDYLKRKLECAILSIQTGALTPELFPILLIFSRLTPPVKETSVVHETALDTAVFVPFIIACGASPMIRVRRLSARALAAIVPGHQLAGLAERLLQDGLPMASPAVGHFGTNQLHGVLLQLAAVADELASALIGVEERQLVFGRLAGLCLDRLRWLALPPSSGGDRGGCCLTLAAEFARALRALLRPLSPEAALRLLQSADGRLVSLIGRRLRDDPFNAASSARPPFLLEAPGGPDMYAACMQLACELLRALGQRSAVSHVPDLASSAAAGLLLTWLEMPTEWCAEIQCVALDWLLHESPRCPLQSDLLSSPSLQACAVRLLLGRGCNGRPPDGTVAGLAAEFLGRGAFNRPRRRRRSSSSSARRSQLLEDEPSLLNRLRVLALSGDNPAVEPCLRLWTRLVADRGGDGCGRLLLRLAAFDQPDRLRLASAKAVRDRCSDGDDRRSNVFDFSTACNELDIADRLDLWEAAATGLMDDSDDVTTETCGCLSALAGWDEPASSSKCLDWLVHCLSSSAVAGTKVQQWLCDAISERVLTWLVDGFYAERIEASIAEAKPIRLFDRSEMNVCWDPLMLCRRLVASLLAVAVTTPPVVSVDCLRRLTERMATATATATPNVMTETTAWATAAPTATETTATATAAPTATETTATATAAPTATETTATATAAPTATETTATATGRSAAWPDPALQSSAFAEVSQAAARLQLARRLLTAFAGAVDVDAAADDVQLPQMLLQSPYSNYIKCGWSI